MVVRRSYDGRAMSYDPRFSLATSYDHRFSRRRTMSYVTSYDIARSSYYIPHERESYNVVQRRTIYPRWSAITLKPPIVGARKTS